jgi:hypothetical protein
MGLAAFENMGDNINGACVWDKSWPGDVCTIQTKMQWGNLNSGGRKSIAAFIIEKGNVWNAKRTWNML